MIDTMKRHWLKLLGTAVMGGGAQAQPAGRAVTTVTFNYTDRYLGDITVDGAWTGGADAFGMGGGAEGLLAPSASSRRAVLLVKWTVADTYDVPSNTYSRTPDEPRAAEVPVAWPYPASPDYLVLHFYPDGHVEAELEADRPKRRIPPPPGYHR